MCDVYLYYFIESTGPVGEKIRSMRPATLEAIRSRGEPVMESQIVVDDTQLDEEGFLVAGVGNDSCGINDIAAQIWSLEVRAASRDSEAMASTDGIEQYMLSLESRELRKQAQVLKSQRTELAAGELQFKTDARDFIHFGRGVVTQLHHR
jgi:hypothetical protein